MKRIPWKYLAGFVDGEGCIDLQVTNDTHIRPRLRIALAACSEGLLKTLHANLGGVLCRRESKNKDWQDAVSWELAGYGPACKVLRNIVNHLILKKEQARLALWMESHIKGQHVSTEVRDAIREELKLMKRDPQRLSEVAQQRVFALMGCDSPKV